MMRYTDLAVGHLKTRLSKPRGTYEFSNISVTSEDADEECSEDDEDDKDDSEESMDGNLSCDVGAATESEDGDEDEDGEIAGDGSVGEADDVSVM